MTWTHTATHSHSFCWCADGLCVSVLSVPVRAINSQTKQLIKKRNWISSSKFRLSFISCQQKLLELHLCSTLERSNENVFLEFSHHRRRPMDYLSLWHMHKSNRPTDTICHHRHRERLYLLLISFVVSFDWRAAQHTTTRIRDTRGDSIELCEPQSNQFVAILFRCRAIKLELHNDFTIFFHDFPFHFSFRRTPVHCGKTSRPKRINCMCAYGKCQHFIISQNHNNNSTACSWKWRIENRIIRTDRQVDKVHVVIGHVHSAVP